MELEYHELAYLNLEGHHGITYGALTRVDSYRLYVEPSYSMEPRD